jgi:two-component system, NtrC family, response regulator HydG
MKHTILVVDDDVDVLKAAKAFLSRKEFEVITESNPKLIPTILRNETIDVVMLDMNFKKGESDGLEGIFWLEKIKSIEKNIIVILITAYADVKIAVDAMKKGATDFITKPWKNEKLLATINSAMELRKSKVELTQFKSSLQKVNSLVDQELLIGPSNEMKNILNVIKKVAPSDANVLILGENGTGKEVIARHIHNLSKSRDHVFIQVDLGALSPTLFESEIFGHEKGAFTDAKTEKEGSLELANNGTLFLDEIGNITPEYQAKLLRVLQTKKTQRLGSTKEISVDFRLICATNKKLYKGVEDGSFRQDLLYRINTVEINLPPLRDRKEDIAFFSQHFIELFAKKYKKGKMKLSEKVINILMKYNWPGNIRELKHTIERAVILSDNMIISENDILIRKKDVIIDFEPKTIEDAEKLFLIKKLKECNGNVSKTAKELGLTRTALYRRINKYGI